MSGKDISKNKVFSSPHKDEIERRLSIGQSPRAISKWLSMRGEEISYGTINEYKKLFFDTTSMGAKIVKDLQAKTADEAQPENIDDELSLKYKEKALVETQVNQGIAQIRAVNHIQVLYENIQDMRIYLQKLQAYEPVVAAHAAKGLYAEIRATIDSLEKIKEKEGSNDDSSVAKLLSQLKKQKRELEESNRGETDE